VRAADHADAAGRTIWFFAVDTFSTASSHGSGAEVPGAMACETVQVVCADSGSSHLFPRAAGCGRLLPSHLSGAVLPKLKYYEAGMDLGCSTTRAASFDLFQALASRRSFFCFTTSRWCGLSDKLFPQRPCTPPAVFYGALSSFYSLSTSSSVLLSPLVHPVLCVFHASLPPLPSFFNRFVRFFVSPCPIRR